MSYIVRGTPLFARAGGLIHLPRPQVGGGEGRSAKAQVQIRPGPFGPPDPPGGGGYGPRQGVGRKMEIGPPKISTTKNRFSRNIQFYIAAVAQKQEPRRVGANPTGGAAYRQSRKPATGQSMARMGRSSGSAFCRKAGRRPVRHRGGLTRSAERPGAGRMDRSENERRDAKRPRDQFEPEGSRPSRRARSVTSGSVKGPGAGQQRSPETKKQADAVSGIFREGVSS